MSRFEAKRMNKLCDMNEIGSKEGYEDEQER